MVADHPTDQPTGHPAEHPVAHPVVRPEDGEHLGQVMRVGTAWRPETVFGGALADPLPTRAEAEDVVRREGLASLVQPWWTGGTGAWERVWLLEVRGSRLRISRTDPRYGPATAEWLDARAADLRRDEPEDGARG